MYTMHIWFIIWGGVHVDVGVGGRRVPVMGCGGTIKKI